MIEAVPVSSMNSINSLPVKIKMLPLMLTPLEWSTFDGIVVGSSNVEFVKESNF
jgi:hypothetical protein